MFAPEVVRCDAEGLDIKFHRCPLKQAWLDAGLAQEEAATLCRVRSHYYLFFVTVGKMASMWLLATGSQKIGRPLSLNSSNGSFCFSHAGWIWHGEFWIRAGLAKLSSCGHRCRERSIATPLGAIFANSSIR
jgi:hypothetical protein